MTKPITSYLVAKKETAVERKNIKLSPDTLVSKRARRIQLWSDDEEDVEQKQNELKEYPQQNELKESPAEVKVEAIEKAGEVRLEEKIEENCSNLQPEIEAVDKSRKNAQKQAILATLGDIKMPAHQKFRSLVKPGKLSLSTHFTFLNDLFAALDSTCLFAQSRSQACLFVKMQKAIENVLSRSVKQEHVEKVHSIYSEAYELKKEKVMHLGKLTESIFIEMKRAKDQIVIKDNQESSPFGQDELLKRKVNFYTRLIAIMKKHHDIFLNEKNISVPFVANWHPDFKYLEIEDILMDPPALLSVPEEKIEIIKENPISPPKPKTLLERIREKERLKTMEFITKDSSMPATILSKLPSIADSLSFLFVTAKKNVLFMGEVVEKLAASSKAPISKDDLQSSLRKLSEICPEWCKITQANAGFIVRIEKGIPMKDVRLKINAFCTEQNNAHK